LNNEHILKIHTFLAKELKWQQDGGSTIFSKPDFAQKIFQLALPLGFPPQNKKAAAIKIVDLFQNQVKLNGSDARIKMYGDVPLAATWWSWLLK
jgi:hypothetical protein